MVVMEAAAIAHGGEIFVLDMGQPVRIVQLAENLIRMYGKVPYEDVKIEFTGLRDAALENDEATAIHALRDMVPTFVTPEEFNRKDITTNANEAVSEEKKDIKVQFDAASQFFVLFEQIKRLLKQ